MDSENKPKWDVKQIGTGVGGSLLALFLLQDKGIDLMSQKQNARDDVIIEKTLANSQRISSLETEVKDLNGKIDRGFNSLRDHIRVETNRVSEVVTLSSKDRWTRSEHNTYKEAIEARFRFIEREIEKLQRDTAK